MEWFFFVIYLFILGAIFGSFICCQVRRIKYCEMNGKKKLSRRSVCLECNYHLKWFDNIPILSWILLRGRCRKCGNKIGFLELGAEIIGSLCFLFIGLSWILAGDFSLFSWVLLILRLAFVVIFGFLAIFDGLYGKLPQFGLNIMLIMGSMICTVIFWIGGFNLDGFMSCLVGIGILAGIYFLLYVCSHEKLVGGGDWILGLAIALAVCDWKLAFFVLLVSNILASCYILIGNFCNKKNKKIYFGPFLFFAYVVVLVGMKFFVNFF